MNPLLTLYGGAGLLARPFLRQMLARRLARGKEAGSRLQERFGIATLPRPAQKLIWLHAASVGETMCVLPVIAALAGSAEVLLTTGTTTSATLAAARLPPHARHQFVPLDVAPWVQKFLSHWRPDCAVFVESEIWPTILRLLDAHGVPRLLVNARMSARSASRWQRVPQLASRLLGGFRTIHAGSAPDAAHLTALGLTDLLLWGNLKFAAPLLPVDDAALAALRALLPGPIFLAASTHSGEEILLLEIHRALLKTFPDLMTIIVPRHPERGMEIAALTGAPRRALGQPPIAGGIYVADTLGELGLFYRLANFAFIGGSLVPHGGQNVIEPARLGLAVLTGPHTENFAEPVTMLAAAGALREVADPAALAAAARAWLIDPAAAQQAGAAGAKMFDPAADLPARLAALILQTSL